MRRFALVLVAAAVLGIAIAAPAIGVSLRKLVRQEVAKQISKASGPQGQAGPRGPQGPQGAGGPPGSPGSAAASLLTGFVPEPKMPYATNVYFVPVGEANDADETSINGNATVILRDLAVEIETPPGLGTGWDIRVGEPGGPGIGCSISGSFATTCNSGSQTATIPPRARIEINITNNLPVAEGTSLRYGYRATTP